MMKHWLAHGTADDLSEARYVFKRDAQIRTGSGVATGALVNLSAEGLRLECAVGMKSGDNVWIEIEGWPRLLAKVVWQRDTLVGCSFFTPISTNALVKMLASARGIDRIADKIFI